MSPLAQPSLPILPTVADLPAVGPGEAGRLAVDLWYHDHRAGLSPERLAGCLALLSPDEHERLARLRDEQRRRHFVVGRALCRRALSRYAPVRPEDWRFDPGRGGKPAIRAGGFSLPLWFNLSHADGVSVCAVTGIGPDIGIDIEQTARGRDGLDIAGQFFAGAEVGMLRALSPSRREEAFVRLWALKESYAKAREISLADSLSGTIFNLARPGGPGIALRAPVHDQPQDWRFTLLRFGEDRLLALAIRTPAPGSLALRASPAALLQCP